MVQIAQHRCLELYQADNITKYGCSCSELVLADGVQERSELTGLPRRGIGRCDGISKEDQR